MSIPYIIIHYYALFALLTVTVSAVYGTVVRSFSPLPEVKTTAGVWPDMCSTSDSSSDIG